MSKQRILHVVGAMNRGGAETMLMSMYRSLDRERVQFDFLEFVQGESDYAAEIQGMGGRIFHCEWSSAPNHLARTINSISQVITREGPFAAVHSHMLFASGIVLAAAAKSNVKVRVAHSHSTSTQDAGMLETGYQIFSRAMMSMFATDLAACTPAAGDYLFGRRRFANRGTVIPNAVDTEQFRKAEPNERMELRSRFGLAQNKLVLVSVARMEPVKNHQFLIELAAQLDLSQVDFDLLLVGDGSLRCELEAAVNSNDLQDRVHFWGLRTDIADILRCADIFLMPSHFEGLPVALVEAQATGIFCLVSENISRDADMGLGLVEFLPIDDHSSWIKLLNNVEMENPRLFNNNDSLLNRDYSVESALEKCLNLYSLEP